MTSRRFVSSVVLLVVALVAPQTVLAGDYTAGTLVQVSGTSPFSGCTADDLASQSGTNFADSEVEPWVDVNPTDPDNIVGISQQDRWSNGGSRGLVAGVSTDGGASWTQVVIPGISDCSGGIYDRSTDPWVSFSPDGSVYQLALSFNDFAPPIDETAGGDFDHALLASKSTDGGFTWSAPIEVIRDLDANVFNDKQSITADPNDSDVVYSIWDRLVFPTSERASVIAGFNSSAYRGPVWFARTTNAGASWEPARMIYDPGQESQTIGNQIVALPDNAAFDGELIDVFDLIKITRGANRTGAYYKVALIRSEDQGSTWGPQARSGKIKPIVIDDMRTIGVYDPETGDPVRTGDIIPDVAVAPNGDLYTVWQDARPNGLQADATVVSRSTDGGFTWSAFAKVNKTPTNIPVGNQQAFTPSVHVAADGTVAVSYYDFRSNDSGSELETDYWIVHCHPSATVSCTAAADWGNEIRITNASFDMRQAPFAYGFFTGDYEGLDSAGNDFTSFFSQPHGSDPASTFFRRVGP